MFATFAFCVLCYAQISDSCLFLAKTCLLFVMNLGSNWVVSRLEKDRGTF